MLLHYRGGAMVTFTFETQLSTTGYYTTPDNATIGHALAIRSPNNDEIVDATRHGNEQ
jgi:hypothetical protein